MNSILATAPAANATETRFREYQELKTRLHQKLLDRLNLERLARTTREIQEILQKGRTTAAYLRTAVKASVPRGSGELRKLGIKLGGRPSKPSRRKQTSDSQE